MAVRVWSSTLKSEPLAVPSVLLRKSSRLHTVAPLSRISRPAPSAAISTCRYRTNGREAAQIGGEGQGTLELELGEVANQQRQTRDDALGQAQHLLHDIGGHSVALKRSKSGKHCMRGTPVV